VAVASAAAVVVVVVAMGAAFPHYTYYV